MVHNIRELDSSQRLAAEQLVGHALREDQRLVIHLLDVVEMPGRESAGNDDQLPAWFSVYEGLTDDEIAAIDQAISNRLDLTRKIDLL